MLSFLPRINLSGAAPYELPASGSGDCFKEVPAAVGKTADQDNILYTVITSVTVTFQQTEEPFRKVSGIVPLSAGLVFIQDDSRKPVVAGQIDPHIRL